ncbi:MAG TPA: nicotinate-nucleotide adenylyltransferase [Spirochaetota bacterium]|nr:nicotinate-nucleotide adenylyltransferase [Spirochaetota bacterium]
MAKHDNPLKIGIYGGTFNPVHYGHLVNVESVRDKFKLDMVIFIPAKMPVHKEMTCYASPEDRLAMVKTAVDGNEYFSVSDMEITRESASYTIYTIDTLERLYPGTELFLIIGSDSFNELDTWKAYTEIIKRVAIIIMQRPGSVTLRQDMLMKGGRFILHENPLIGISSSGIRERIMSGHSIKYMTPDSVIDYIYSKGLYKIG